MKLIRRPITYVIFLADRTARSRIGYWYEWQCPLSVCLSVRL